MNENQDNPFQPDVNYRGYTASPLVGTPAGWKRVEILLDEKAIAEYGSSPAEVLARHAERSESGRELETTLTASA